MASRSKKKKQRRAESQFGADINAFLSAYFGSKDDYGNPDENDARWQEVVAESYEEVENIDKISLRRFLSLVRAGMLRRGDLASGTESWLNNASYDQLLVALCVGVKKMGSSPKEYMERLYPALSGYDAYAHYVDVVCVNFAKRDTPAPMFPVFEVKCGYGIPDIPDCLVMDITKGMTSSNELVDLILRDPRVPKEERAFYVGHMEYSESLREFNRLRRIFGFFFLRLSYDPAQVQQVKEGERPFTSNNFYPPSGVYYKDYMVFDNLAKRPSERETSPVAHLPSGAHRFIEDAVYTASAHGPRKFVEVMTSKVYERFDGWSDVHQDAVNQTSSIVKTFFAKPMQHTAGEKFPWKLRQETSFRSKNKKMMLKHLFRIMDDMKDKSKTAELEEDRKVYASIYSSLQKARTYEFTPAAFHRVFRACEEYVLRDTLGLEFASAEEFHLHMPPEETDAFIDLLAEECCNVPFPEHLPFGCCYFGWGSGVLADVYNRESFKTTIKHSKYEDQTNVNTLVLLGHLVTESGDVVSFYDSIVDQSESIEVIISHDREADQEAWAPSATLTPWMIVTIAGEILSHAVVEQQDLTSSEKRRYTRMGKLRGIKRPIPPNYYTVYVRDKFIKRRIRKASTGTGRKKSYCSDVEGHPRLLYIKGMLPISEKKQHALEKRDYTIYPYGVPIPADLQAMVMERSKEFPKRGEWVALRKVFVKPYISPNPDENPHLPYVPAVRKTTKGLTSANYKEKDDDE